jgi:hypothetical protein
LEINRSDKMFLKKFVTALCLTIFPLIIFQGCGTKETVKSLSDKEILLNRVDVYWGHKIKQEFDKNYEFEEPLYRKKISLVNYIKGFNTYIVKWNRATAENIKMEDGTAMVGLKVRVQIKLPGIKMQEHDSLIEEKWVKVEGMWYHVP